MAGNFASYITKNDTIIDNRDGLRTLAIFSWFFTNHSSEKAIVFVELETSTKLGGNMPLSTPIRLELDGLETVSLSDKLNLMPEQRLKIYLDASLGDASLVSATLSYVEL